MDSCTEIRTLPLVILTPAMLSSPSPSATQILYESLCIIPTCLSHPLFHSPLLRWHKHCLKTHLIWHFIHHCTNASLLTVQYVPWSALLSPLYFAVFLVCILLHVCICFQCSVCFSLFFVLCLQVLLYLARAYTHTHTRKPPHTGIPTVIFINQLKMSSFKNAIFMKLVVRQKNKIKILNHLTDLKADICLLEETQN